MLRQRQPRVKDEKHRRFIASLPCCVCGKTDVQAAHIRHQNGGGLGMKPSDMNCIPLCVGCHLNQGSAGELNFWGAKLEPAKELAHALFYYTGREDMALKLISRFRR